jgi:hypothetical protein
MRKSQHQLRDEVNQAEASLRKEMSDQTKLHETVFRRVMAACLERPYMRHSLDPDETIYLQVSLESRVFRDIVEADRTAEFEREILRGLQHELATVLEIEAASIHKQLAETA